MKYIGDVYRAPSEANSLLVQVTTGCSHNQCTFCYMYKDKPFSIRPLPEIVEELKDARTRYDQVKRVFLIDGDALVLRMSYLQELLTTIRELFPECERVGTSATAEDILRKTPGDLAALQKLGLNIIYMGVESGSDTILTQVRKGTTAERLIAAGKQVRAAGILLSVSLIAGLGGVRLSSEHAIETARVVNAIQPDFIGLLTLLAHENAPLTRELAAGTFQLPTAHGMLLEIQNLVQHLELKACTFRGNHASNYIPLKAALPEEKERLLTDLHILLNSREQLKPETLRRF